MQDENEKRKKVYAGEFIMPSPQKVSAGGHGYPNNKLAGAARLSIARWWLSSATGGSTSSTLLLVGQTTMVVTCDENPEPCLMNLQAQMGMRKSGNATSLTETVETITEMSGGTTGGKDQRGPSGKVKFWITAKSDHETSNEETTKILEELLLQRGVEFTETPRKKIPTVGGPRSFMSAIEVSAKESWVSGLPYSLKSQYGLRYDIDDGGAMGEEDTETRWTIAGKIVLPQGMVEPRNLGEELQMRREIKLQVGPACSRIQFFGPYGPSAKPKEFVLYRKGFSTAQARPAYPGKISVRRGDDLLYIAPRWRRQVEVKVGRQPVQQGAATTGHVKVPGLTADAVDKVQSCATLVVALEDALSTLHKLLVQARDELVRLSVGGWQDESQHPPTYAAILKAGPQTRQRVPPPVAMRALQPATPPLVATLRAISNAAQARGQGQPGRAREDYLISVVENTARESTPGGTSAPARESRSTAFGTRGAPSSTGAAAGAGVRAAGDTSDAAQQGQHSGPLGVTVTDAPATAAGDKEIVDALEKKAAREVLATAVSSVAPAVTAAVGTRARGAGFWPAKAASAEMTVMTKTAVGRRQQMEDEEEQQHCAAFAATDGTDSPAGADGKKERPFSRDAAGGGCRR